MTKKLYVAYGSNLNIRQMKLRCPTAKLIGTGIVRDYELQFKGAANHAYATIAENEGETVPVAVWELQPRDEKSLDRYEGYPSHYFKQDIPVKMDNGKEVTGMVYVMDLKQKFGMPSAGYLMTVSEGYDDCKLDLETLKNAVKKSAIGYAEDLIYNIELQNQPTLFDTGDNDEDFDEESDGWKYFFSQ